MFPSRLPAVIAAIERRIRHGEYTGTLPATAQLQRQFGLARQSVTEAVRRLTVLGLLSCESRRHGMTIHRERLLSGSIAVISMEKCNLRRSRLFRQIHEDGLTPRQFFLEELPVELTSLPRDTRGVLFVHSAMTIPWAKLLQEAGMPFVSCNCLFSSPQVDMVDFRVEDNIAVLVNYLQALGKRRIGLFYSGRTEGFNELFWHGIRNVKKAYGLPREPYDGIRINWKDTFRQKLEHTLRRMGELKSFPEALISFCDIRPFLNEALQNTQVTLPPDFLFMVQRPYSKKPREHAPNIITFHTRESTPLPLLAGYQRLRELIFAPTQLRPVTRYVTHDFVVDSIYPNP